MRTSRLRSIPTLPGWAVRWGAGALLALALPGPGLSAPGKETGPGAELVPILLKVLSFDKTLNDRPGEELRIVVIDEPENERSRRIAAETVLRFLPYAGQRIHGRKIQVDRRSADDLLRRSDPEIEVLYLAPGLRTLLPNLLDWSRRNGVISFTACAELGERGVAVWLSETDGTPRILINLVQLRAEGREFDARLLRLATVRR